MELEIRQAIVTALAGVTGITGGIHFGKAPELVDSPYCVFWTVATSTSRDTVRSFEDYWVQFDVYDKDVSPVSVEDIGKDIFDALDGATFTLTDWWTLDIYGLYRPRTFPADEKYWQSITEIMMKFQKK